MKQPNFKEKELNEGVISYATDLIMAFRIVKILYQDWTKTKAFELGIIDENGKKIKDPKGLEERSAYSPFIRLIFRIKRLINLVPGGNTKLGSITAAYAMLRESEDAGVDILGKLTLEDLNALFEEYDLEEDTPVNVTTGVATQEKPIAPPIRRNWKDMEKFASSNIFDVESHTFKKAKEAKKKYERWDKYINEEDGEVGQDILKFAKTYHNRGILLREKGTGSMVFLRRNF